MIKHIVSYIFSIPFANFVCVMGVLGYLIKTRLIPVIDAAMEEKEAAKLALKELAQTTEHTCETVNESTEEQKLYAQELLEKLKEWNGAIEESQEQESEKRLQGRRAITSLIQKQEKTLTKQYLLKKITPIVMNDATEKLIKTFSSKSQQQDFLNNALENLEQEAA